MSAQHTLFCPCLLCQKLGPPTMPNWQIGPPPRPCEHCYCKWLAVSSGDGAHKQCCNCGNRQRVPDEPSPYMRRKQRRLAQDAG